MLFSEETSTDNKNTVSTVGTFFLKVGSSSDRIAMMPQKKKKATYTILLNMEGLKIKQRYEALSSLNTVFIGLHFPDQQKKSISFSDAVPTQ